MSADSDDDRRNNTSPSAPPGPSDNRQPKWAWWVIGILIPVLAIVIPVLATVWLTSQEDDAANNAAPSTSPSAQETEADPPSTTAPTSPVSSASPTASVRWTGEVRIAEDGLTLDEMPPEHIPGGDGDIKLGLVNPPRVSAMYTPDLALWPGKSMPSEQQCSELVSTQGTRNVEATVGAVICVSTVEGRTAALTVTATSNSFTTGVTARATVWSGASD